MDMTMSNREAKPFESGPSGMGWYGSNAAFHQTHAGNSPTPKGILIEVFVAEKLFRR